MGIIGLSYHSLPFVFRTIHAFRLYHLNGVMMIRSIHTFSKQVAPMHGAGSTPGLPLPPALSTYESDNLKKRRLVSLSIFKLSFKLMCKGKSDKAAHLPFCKLTVLHVERSNEEGGANTAL